MPLDDLFLTLDARWIRLFRAFKAVQEAETNLVLRAELKRAEHRLRIAYTMETEPKETSK